MHRSKDDEQPYVGPTIPLPTHPPSNRPNPARSPQPLRSKGSLNKPPKQVIGWRTWLRRIGVGIVAVLVLTIVGLLVLQQSVARQVVVPDTRTNRPIRNLLTAPSNILLLGVDLRPDYPQEGVRSDTLMLLHLDPGGGWASLLAIPRDSLALVPNEGETKINRGFASGYEASGGSIAEGMASAADTVEPFLQLAQQGQRIDYVATVNFDGFAALVDALGGIEVDVPRRIVDEAYPTPDFGTRVLIIEAGRQRMDGQRALEYVRTRHADSDFGRGERQQQVLRAMSATLRGKPLPLRPFVALRVLQAASGAIQTTMPVGRLDALLLALNLVRFDPASILQHRLTPETVAVQEEGSDLRWDPAGVAQVVATALTPPGEAQEQATLQVLNGTEVIGLAAKVSETLATAKFALVPPDNAPTIAESQIIVYEAKPYTQRRLVQTLGKMPVVERPASEAPPGVHLVVMLGEDYAQYVDP